MLEARSHGDLVSHQPKAHPNSSAINKLPADYPIFEGKSFLLLDLILCRFHAAVVARSRVHRNSVPFTQMRCMITAITGPSGLSARAEDEG